MDSALRSIGRRPLKSIGHDRAERACREAEYRRIRRIVVEALGEYSAHILPGEISRLTQDAARAK